MAFLTVPVNPAFPDVYQIEVLDRVKGGPGGTANLQASQLAERTAYVKKQIDDAVSGALTVMYANRLKTARNIAMTGDGSWNVTFDGNGNVTAAMALKSSVALTGAPTAPTAAAGTNTTQLATTAFVQAAVAALVASSPAALDTLNELAAALGNDANFATTMTNALALKAPLASPALTGNPTAPTPTNGDNDTSLATTAFVQALVNGRLSKSVAGGATVTLTAAEAGYGIIEFTGALTANIAVVVPSVSGQWIIKNATTGAYTLTVKTAAGTGVAITQGTAWQVYCDGTNVVDGITDFKDLALTGVPTAPTAAAGTNTTQIASTAFVQAAVAALIASSPAALDTLNELATALGNDPNFATTMTNALAAKAPLASPALTGTPTAPTAATGTSTTQVATTAFVQQELAADLATAAPQMDGVAAVGNSTKVARENHVHPTDTSRAPLASPAFTGNPTAPTPTTGDNDTSLATTAFVQSAVNGKLAKSVAGGATVTLTAVEAGYAMLELTGALTANIAVVVPTATAQWIVKNATTGTYTLTVKTAAGTGVAVTQGVTQSLYCDGTNVLEADGGKADKATTLAGYGITDAKQIQSIAASVAANALTLTINPTSLDFRANALSSGTVNTRSVAAAVSLVVPAGATLGTISGQSARLVLLAIDNAGTVELAVANLSGGVNLDETTLISTTAISAAATSASTIYSATARANVPFRVVGFIDITEAAAGTWATAPTTIQGIGGQALAALSSLGYGQTWQNMTSSRAVGTTYYNTTGRPIYLAVLCTQVGATISMTINGVSVPVSFGYASSSERPFGVVIPAFASYSLNSGPGIYSWYELR